MNILSNEGDESARQRLQTLFPAPEFLDEWNFSLLHRTVFGLNPLPLDMLLDSLPKTAIDQGDAHNRTALWWAARRGDFPATSQLLKSGADPNKRTIIGGSPLTAAIRARHQMCIKKLLEHGSDICDLDDTQGTLPVHLSCYYGSDIDVVDACLGGKVFIDERIRHSLETPLMLAVQKGHLRIIKYLISQGAGLNTINSDGETPLLIAISNNRPEAASILLQSGADYTHTTIARETILHHAAQFGDLECLKVLHTFDLAGIDADDKVTGTPQTQRFNVKELTALQIAEKRLDVSTEWKDMFRKLIDDIKHPKSQIQINVMDDSKSFEVDFKDFEDNMEDFKDASEQQCESESGM